METLLTLLKIIIEVIIGLMIIGVPIFRITLDDYDIRYFRLIPLLKPTIHYKVKHYRKIITVNFNNEPSEFRDEYMICRSIPLFIFYKDYLKFNTCYSDKELKWVEKDKGFVFKTEEDANNLLEDMKNNPNNYQFYV
jgi:hypothetical protein